MKLRTRTLTKTVVAPAFAALVTLAVAGILSACASPQANPTAQNQGATMADIEPSAEIPQGTGPIVAFYGDSYTLGTGASGANKRWSSIISDERGWREVNPSVNGLGFVNNRSSVGDGDLPSVIIGVNPDIVFVTMGLNDNFSFDRAADEIHDQIDADFARLTHALPDARFVVVEPFWYTDVRPASVETIIGWVRDAATTIDADYIDGASHWIEGHPEWMAADGLHPNDDGYAAMAQRMDAELTQVGL